jgi:histidine phosphotransferase ChpT
VALPVELLLVEYVAARLCHDLVGPVGAVANGVELLNAVGERVDPEVAQLIGDSARLASHRLQFFRVALGSANALPSAGRHAEIRRLADGLFAGSRITLDWGLRDNEIEALLGRTGAKVLLILAAIAFDALPRRGRVRVEGGSGEGGKLDVSVSALDGEVRVPDEIRAALNGAVAASEITPRNVPAYIAARLAQVAGGRTRVGAIGPNNLDLLLELPAGA